MKISKVDYYLNIAREVAKRSTCTRRKFGAILVKDDTIIATGYNGSARGTLNCGEEVNCLKDIHKEDSIKSYNFCPAVHSEMNVIFNAARSGVSTVGSTLYLAEDNDNCEEPCLLCRRFMLQAGIVECYYYDKYIQQVVCSDRESWLAKEDIWMKGQESI
jgi:dCMP deaminase